MTGEATWLTAAILLFGLTGIVALAMIGQRIGLGLSAMRRRVTCPKLRKDCDCVLLRRASDGRLVDVASCSAFDDPERVQCKKTCLVSATA